MKRFISDGAGGAGGAVATAAQTAKAAKFIYVVFVKKKLLAVRVCVHSTGSYVIFYDVLRICEPSFG